MPLNNANLSSVNAGKKVVYCNLEAKVISFNQKMNPI